MNRESFRISENMRAEFWKCIENMATIFHPLRTVTRKHIGKWIELSVCYSIQIGHKVGISSFHFNIYSENIVNSYIYSNRFIDLNCNQRRRKLLVKAVLVYLDDMLPIWYLVAMPTTKCCCGTFYHVSMSDTCLIFPNIRPSQAYF